MADLQLEPMQPALLYQPGAVVLKDAGAGGGSATSSRNSSGCSGSGGGGGISGGSSSSALTQNGDSSSDAAAEDWISWFCSLKGNLFFVKVDRSFFQDPFNLVGLDTLIPYFNTALDIVLDNADASELDSMDEAQRDKVESAAEILYGLAHQRFVLTNKGMRQVRIKYKRGDYGRCHRVHCRGQHMLPVGQSDNPNVTSVNVFCPRCKDIYFPHQSELANLDGAFFGTTLPHLYLLTYPSENPEAVPTMYIPRIYGFRIFSPIQKN